MRVLLIDMPFASLGRPSLGLSLLSARLERDGHRCDVEYLCFRLADYIGAADYRWVAEELSYTAFAGDWLFAPFVSGKDQEADLRYVEDILIGQWRLGLADVDRLLKIRSYCGHFLSDCERAIDWNEYALVGFTSTFTQNLSSLALASRIKKSHPRALIAFGGANWEGEMGIALHEEYRFVDFAVRGEADESLPLLAARIETGSSKFDDIPGLVYRRGDESVVGADPVPVRDLNALPYPNYDSYFRALGERPSGNDILPTVLLETARGCWWGERRSCAFCGLNGDSRVFRSKDPDRALAEMRYLKERYGSDQLEVVDNIMDMKYFESLLPSLKESGLGVSLFYEVKSSLTKAQVKTLAEAGVLVIQPGIESLSDHVLSLMGKGASAIQNVELLKWCKRYGVHPEWNMLHGFPGEASEDYDGMIPLIMAAWFLEPPRASGPVRLDRFSRYFDEAEAHGIVDVRPLSPYRFIYRLDDSKLRRIAYYFEYSVKEGLTCPEGSARMSSVVERWKADPNRGALSSRPADDGSIEILDTRPFAARARYRLTGWRARAYADCDTRRDEKSLVAEAVGLGATEAEISAFLRACIATGLMIKNGSNYLSLAIEEEAPAVDALEPGA